MNLPAVEGRLDIDLYPERPRGERVDIRSSRPLQVTNLLLGKTPEQALAILPALYAVCATAQTRALLAALQQSLSIPVASGVNAARDMLVWLETAREHSIRLVLDWPRLFELSIDREALAVTRDRIDDFSQSLFDERGAFTLESRLRSEPARLEQMIDELESDLQRYLFRQPLSRWHSMRTGSEFEQWARQGESIAARSLACAFEAGWQLRGGADCPQLPSTDAGELLCRFDQANAEAFVAAPEWRGTPRETSALTRQLDHPLVQALMRVCGNALMTRWAARLLELAAIPRRLRRLLGELDRCDRAAPDGPGAPDGVAQVEAVRGRLVHRVRVEDGVIARFQVLAPTEWNFHPRGLLSRSLDSLLPADPGRLERLARLVIDAIDPCVGYRLRIH